MVSSKVTPTVSHLREVNLLRKFSDSELADLIKLGQLQNFEPHSNIVIEGELSWGIFLLLEGTVGIFKTNKLVGNLYDLGQLHAGAFFGEMSLIDENPRAATVKSLTDCSVFHISRDQFMVFLERAPDRKSRFFESCTRDLIQRLRELGDNYVVSQYQLWKSATKKEVA